MDRIVITIHPKPSDDALLSVKDAFQQVLDTLNLFEEAHRALGAPHSTFEWKLERASTNTPFTVYAIPEAVDPAVDIAPFLENTKAEVARGIEDAIRGEPPRWMSFNGAGTVRNFFARNINGVALTEIDLGANVRISIDEQRAVAAVQALAARDVFADVLADLPDRTAFGEIEGIMVAAGRYRNRPAIQIRSELYSYVWCVLSDELISRFGSEHTMADVWRGKTVGVGGRLYYVARGKLSRIEAAEIREIEAAPPVDLDSILDPDFTAGMDPHEYLDKLHAGEIG
jgi:hypothetical protein